MDPLTWLAIAAVASAAIGGGAAMYSANKSAASAKEINKQNIDLSKEQAGWQEDMSNTAHRREVVDLRAAGLNPILSAFGQGAKVGQYDLPKLSNPMQGIPELMNSTGKSMSEGFLSAANTISQTKLNSASAEYNNAKTREANANARIAEMDANFLTRAGDSPWFAKYYSNPFRMVSGAGGVNTARVQSRLNDVGNWWNEKIAYKAPVFGHVGRFLGNQSVVVPEYWKKKFKH